MAAKSAELEWRRQWKPDLKSSSWKTQKIGEDTFLIKSLFFDGGYEILISDLTNTWYEYLEDNDLQKRSKLLNPSVDAPVTRLLQHIQSSLEEDDSKKSQFQITFKTDAEVETTSCKFSINSELAGFPFVWKFYAMEAEKEMVVEQMTVPLLTMVGELHRRQLELFKLLKAKDKEIDDYKGHGAKVSRKHLETGLFDEVSFANTMNTSKDFERQVRHLGINAFSQPGQDLYRDIMTKHAWLTAPAEEKAEDALMAGLSTDTPSGTVEQSWGNRLPMSLISGLSPSGSPVKVSPRNSPLKSPAKNTPTATPETTPTKDTELLRRQALEKRLADEESRKEVKAKKKRKLKL
ncbi:non-homologous end-joining factor 1-like [Lineus longissimus]|uniref:non-homologous end-joining factor 1-like n=1 Tax=Lineus longissimus TaxID=88925 RepID=UPI002B4F4800